jgi:tRNA (guanine9-N1)-methyltransferase
MAEFEERPSKIRRLNSPVEDESPQSISAVQEAPERPIAEAISDQPGHPEEQPPCEGKNESEDKPKLSKSQLKRLRKAEQWEAGKQYRKTQRKMKKQARKAEQRAELQAKIANGEAAIMYQPGDKEKQKRPRRPIQVPVSLILDCDFNELMTEKELISLGAQLTRCYSENKKTAYRSHLALSSWGGTLKSRFETVLTNNHLGWKGVKFYEGDFVAAAENLDEVMRSPSGGKVVGALAKDIRDAKETEPTLLPSAPSSEGSAGFNETHIVVGTAILNDPETYQNSNGSVITEPKSTVPPTIDSVTLREDISLEGEDSLLENEDSAVPTDRASPSLVYLTSDSPHTLECLSSNTSYIIGGIVDKNRHKGLCYKRACERGIPTAKLPIGEYMIMQSRSVLAINHVVEIMLKWLVTGDWGEAFLSVIPKRKEAKLKIKKGEENQAKEEESEDEDGASVLENKTEEAGEEKEFDGFQ